MSTVCTFTIHLDPAGSGDFGLGRRRDSVMTCTPAWSQIKAAKIPTRIIAAKGINRRWRSSRLTSSSTLESAPSRRPSDVSRSHESWRCTRVSPSAVVQHEQRQGVDPGRQRGGQEDVERQRHSQPRAHARHQLDVAGTHPAENVKNSNDPNPKNAPARLSPSPAHPPSSSRKTSPLRRSGTVTA